MTTLHGIADGCNFIAAEADDEAIGWYMPLHVRSMFRRVGQLAGRCAFALDRMDMAALRIRSRLGRCAMVVETAASHIRNRLAS